MAVRFTQFRNMASFENKDFAR